MNWFLLSGGLLALAGVVCLFLGRLGLAQSRGMLLPSGYYIPAETFLTRNKDKFNRVGWRLVIVGLCTVLIPLIRFSL
jgi:hypothetical protein